MGRWAEYHMYLWCSPDGPIGQKALPDPPIYLIFTQCPNQLITKGKMGPWVICRVPDIGPWVNCRKINMGRHWLTSRHPYDIEIGRLVAFPNLMSLLVPFLSLTLSFSYLGIVEYCLFIVTTHLLPSNQYS
jgi:hypothetical protein